MSAHLPSAAPDPGQVLARAVAGAAARLGVRKHRLAEVIGTSASSVSRLSAGRRIDPRTKEGELALLFVRLYRSLAALVGGDDAQARAWLHAENVHLNGVPAEQIRRVEGLIDVIQYLDGMRGRL